MDKPVPELVPPTKREREAGEQRVGLSCSYFSEGLRAWACFP